MLEHEPRGLVVELVAEDARAARPVAAHKVARLLSLWQVGRGDYVEQRDAAFAGETVDSLFDQAAEGLSK